MPKNPEDAHSLPQDPNFGVFLIEFTEVLTSLQWIAKPLGGNLLSVADKDGNTAHIDFVDLFNIVSQGDRSKWRGLIEEQLDRKGPPALARAQIVMTAGLAGNQKNLRPMLKRAVDCANSPAWFQPLARIDKGSEVLSSLAGANEDPAQFHSLINKPFEDLSKDPKAMCILLGIDLPENIVYATQEMVSESGRPGSEWLQLAYQNLQANTPEDWFMVLDQERGLRWIKVHDSYDAPRALILDQLLPGIAEKGWFVAPVGRDNLYFMPATEYTADFTVVHVKEMVSEQFKVDPYALSEEIYWVYQGRWYRFPILMFGDIAMTMPPDEFQSVFGLLDKVKAAEKAKPATPRRHNMPKRRRKPKRDSQ